METRQFCRKYVGYCDVRNAASNNLEVLQLHAATCYCYEQCLVGRMTDLQIISLTPCLFGQLPRL